MSTPRILLKHEYCSSCLLYSVNEKCLESYVLKDVKIAFALQENEITLCAACKRKAQQAEQFLKSIWNNQKLWKEDPYTTPELILKAKQDLPGVKNLTTTELIIIEINNENDIKTKEKATGTHNEKVWSVSHQQPQPQASPSKLNVKEIEVKVEVVPNEPHSSDEWNNMDDADESTQYGIPIAEEQDNNKKHMQAFKAAMEKFNSKVKAEPVVRTVPDRICKPRPLRGKKKPKDNVVLINISREDCMAERAKMATDVKYIEAPFKCENCLKGFMMKSAFENHMEKHSEDYGNYICDICFQRADSEEKMYLHKKYHFVRYKCPACGIMRICRTTIQEHYMIQHAQVKEELHCPHCPRTFKRVVTRKKHIMYHHRGRTRVHCQLCPKTYANREGLLTHCVNVHPNETQMVQRRPYVCAHCDKAFTAPSHLKKHEIKHTNKKEFYCVECDKSFKSESILKHHLKVATPHVNYMELPFPCLKCDKRFSVRRDLEFHMNGTHLKIKPYQCDQCDRAYPSKCSLRKHVQVVHIGIPKLKHPCPMCGKEFDNLKNHMRTHTGERPFECNQCPMKFSQSSILNTHIRLIHLKLTRKGLRRPEK